MINKKKYNISLVVIGKNSLELLEKIYINSYMAEVRRYFSQIIYVDSLSTDDSTSFMKSLGFDVYITDFTSPASASCGRFIGTIEAKGDFILYLDSDMRLENISIITEALASSDEYCIGTVGQVVDYYPNGKTRVRQRRDNKIASSFGGFVCLKREHVLSCGNWNPNLKANEELDLQNRICRGGYYVQYKSFLKVEHYTAVTSSFHELLSIYYPIRPDRYGALGKVLRAQRNISDFLHLIVLQSEVFIFIVSILALLVSPTLTLILLILLLCITLSRRSYRYLLVIPGLSMGVLFGLIIGSKKAKVTYEKV